MGKRIKIICDGRQWHRTSIGKEGTHLWHSPDGVKRCAACGRTYEEVTR